MQYTEKTEAYNERRYGKPWLAIVTTSLTKDFQFIDWSGRWGCAGEFVFDAPPGTMLAYGQKDHRKGRGGVNGYHVCMPDGSIPTIADSWAAELRKLSPGDRWKAAAEKFMHVAVTRYHAPMPEDSEYYRGVRQQWMDASIRWAKLLGVQSPIMADIADALGLIDHPAPVPAQSPAAVSMEAFF